MADPVQELAYKAYETQLQAQADNLTGFRNRATTILSVAALLATLSTGLGFVNSNNQSVLPTWTPWVLLGVVAGVGIASMTVLWPIMPWYSSPDYDEILRLQTLGHDEKTIYGEILKKFAEQVESNEKALVGRSLFLKIGALLLVGEVIVLIIAAGTHS